MEDHNKEAALGMHSYELAMNHLGDMVSSAPPPSLGSCPRPPSSEASTNASNVPRRHLRRCWRR